MSVEGDWDWSDDTSAPWRTGPATMGVGLRPIDPARWLAPDDQRHWLAGKADIVARAPTSVFGETSQSRPAQEEACGLVEDATGRTAQTALPPLLAASLLVSDDLVVMQRGPEGWTAGAASLCAPTFFSVGDALGQSLGGLHRPVPDGDPGLSGRIGRVFDHMAEGMVLERHNWTVQWGDTRHTPSGAPLRAAAEAASVAEARTCLHLRVERQTIRRLSVSGAVLFTIRIRLRRLADELADPGRAAAFASSWAATAQAVRAYKRWAVLERHVASLL